MITINGNCTPSVTVDIDFEENPNGLPIVWLKTGYKHGIYAPLNKKAVMEIIIELQKLLLKM